jgi:hypothetical protein
VVVTVKLPAVPTTNAVLLALVMAGAVPPLLIVKVKLCVAAVPIPLLAVNVIGNVPVVDAAGVSVNVPVPSPLSLNVTPFGSAPVSLNEGVGFPVVVTVKLASVPTVKVVLLALVIVGAWFTELAVKATNPRVTSSLEDPVPNVAVWAPAVDATLYSNICPFNPTKLFPKLPLVTSNVFLSSSPVYAAPVEQVVVTPKQAANTRSLAFEVVSPLIVAIPPEAGVVLY